VPSSCVRGLLAEHERTRVLPMLDAIQEKLGIEHDADSEISRLGEGDQA